MVARSVVCSGGKAPPPNTPFLNQPPHVQVRRRCLTQDILDAVERIDVVNQTPQIHVVHVALGEVCQAETKVSDRVTSREECRVSQAGGLALRQRLFSVLG